MVLEPARSRTISRLAYEETRLLLSLPSESPQPTSPLLGADLRAVNASSFSPLSDASRSLTWQQGATVLIAVILGAILGGVAAHASEGSLVWGVVVGEVLARW